MTASVECAACSNHDVYPVEMWPTGKRAQAMACPECGLLFVHPPLSQNTLEACDAATGAEASPSSNDAIAPSKNGASRALIAALDRYFPASQPSVGARALGIGTGARTWLNAFQDRGWETHAGLTAIPPDAQFDFVIVYHLLEHLARPLDALHRLARTIRPGGYCFVSVPRLDTVAEHRRVQYCLRPGKHIAAFTEACLRGLLARAGLDVVAALHELDTAFTRGAPIRLRLLARKVDTTTREHDPAAALRRILATLSEVDLAAKPPADTPPLADPRECPACSGGHVRIVEQWRLPGHQSRAAACMVCGLLFVHPQPSREVLAAYYTPEGYQAWKASHDRAWTNQVRESESPATRRSPVLFTALDRFFPVIKPARGARVLDFGCGPGAWLDRFQDHGWETHGIEPCTAAAFARHTRLLEIPTEPQFDLVFLYHVLEHLPRPLDTLRQLAHALLPGGYCFVSVPRLDTLPVHRQFDYCLHRLHHIVGFTEPCLRGLLARVGLEVVASFYEFAGASKKGLPTHLRVLARKTATAPVLEPDPASALKPLIEFLTTQRKNRDHVDAPIRPSPF